jgi:YebC/PmpR family DNA-binding regulatory protein
MSGHSHWAGIKHKKGLADQKRGQLFSKLLNAIAIAARENSDPEFNPKLRAAIEKARANQVPVGNIERAIKRSLEDKNLEELVIEAYGPEGVAILITAVTDNKNRTIAEIKKVLDEYGAKWAQPGSVRWAFELPTGGEGDWQAKFKQKISDEAKQQLRKLTEELENRDDVQKIHTNT